MRLCLWEQDSSGRGGPGADNQLAFREGGPLKLQSVLLIQAAPVLSWENTHIRDGGGGTLPFVEIVFAKGRKEHDCVCKDG